MRAFLAVPVRPPTHQPVLELMARLAARVAGVRWVDPATVHVTLHFFADLATDQQHLLVDGVRGATAGQPGFPLQLAALGSFGAGTRTRVLWLGIAESVALLGLAERVRSAVAGCGFELDEGPFRPHITLGRPGRRFDVAAWRAEVSLAPNFPVFTADRVVLYEFRDGHHVREVFPLEAASAASP